MKSKLFYSEAFIEIEKRIVKFLNSHPDLLSKDTVESPRAAGDAIENILSDNFEAIIGKYGANCSSDFARRAMADIAFEDSDKFYYVVDVKTHRTTTSFNMPNITSVERLARFYEDDKNYFVILMVEYSVVSASGIKVTKAHFVPIEFLAWECLTIGALGWGQIQIANSNNIVVKAGNSRKEWMLEFCDTLAAFYPREIEKIAKRVEYFEKVRMLWEKKTDVWK